MSKRMKRQIWSCISDWVLLESRSHGFSKSWLCFSEIVPFHWRGHKGIGWWMDLSPSVWRLDHSLSRFEMICNHNIWQHFWDDELFQNSAFEWLDIWKWRQKHAKRRSGSGLYFVWASSHSLQRNENKKQATFMTLWLWWWVKTYRWCLYILVLYLYYI